jgi:hypothetical protein
MGETQVVMATGKEARRKDLPIRAGLKMFCPSPPKRCFATTMAKMEPKAAIQTGNVGGRQKARSSPVTIALNSLVGSFFITLRQTYSAA